jgi:hypothetical protein
MMGSRALLKGKERETRSPQGQQYIKQVGIPERASGGDLTGVHMQEVFRFRRLILKGFHGRGGRFSCVRLKEARPA